MGDRLAEIEEALSATVEEKPYIGNVPVCYVTQKQTRWLINELTTLRSDLQRVTGERDKALGRCRTAAQTLIEVIVSVGPENVEDAAKRTAKELTDLRAKLERVEGETAECCLDCEQRDAELGIHPEPDKCSECQAELSPDDVDLCAACDHRDPPPPGTAGRG